MKIPLLLLFCIPAMLFSIGITFTFDNAQVTSSGTTSYYEFDVMAHGSESGTNLAGGCVYINYNVDAFGDNVNYNGKLLVTDGDLIFKTDYDYNVVDNADARLAVTYWLDYDPVGNPLPTTPAKLLHIRLTIADGSQLCGISFESDLMGVFEQWYNRDNSYYDPVTSSDTLNDPLIAAPTATAATAVCHNGFTAHWGAVSGASSYRLDVLEDDGTTYITGYENLTVNRTICRVEGLDEYISYKYRVRAYNGNSSLSSNVIDVTTTEVNPGTSANTAIEGAAVTVDVPLVTDDPAFSDNDVSIDPDNSDNFDFSVVLSWHPSGYDDLPNLRLLCTISCSDNSALNGDYTINHTGMGFAPTAALYKWGGSWNSISFTGTESSTSFSISGLSKGAKGDLLVGFDDGTGTLPIELSSFTAMLNSYNNVSLQWVTQSETNVSGFRVYRGSSESLDEAGMLNVFIPATNTSQLQVYVYNDLEICEDGTYYYWLENLDMDGSNTFHGPTSIEVSLSHPGNPEIPIIQGISSAYPNPFNPTVNLSCGNQRAGITTVEVYNLRGQKVRTLFNGARDKGNFNISWDGKDDNGSKMPSGIYMIRMNASGTKSIRKVVMSQ